MSDMMVFADETETLQKEKATWKLFIVDDDESIHHVTKLALKDLKFKDKYLSFESAYSAEEAIAKLKDDPQFCIVLLDIGMETSDAGLDVANFIRQQLKDDLTRIIIRTGQPGDVPEKDIIDNYDINDYKSKTELTVEKLFSAIRTAIAQYDQINELANLNDELEERITQALETQKKQQEALFLQDRTVQMSELLNMLAHQWRQPLSRISAVTTQLKFALALGDIDPEAFNQQVDGIEKYTHELSDTIEEFRSVYEPAQLSENTPVCTLLEKSASVITASFQDVAIKIDVLCDKEERGYFTSTALYQVLLSLLRNSQEAFKENKIDDAKITLSSQRKDGLLHIYVEDNAGGIKEEYLNKIFDPYFSTKNKKNGHGLGLYMSKSIIEQNCKGSLEVNNTENGCRFTIILPNK